MTARECNTCGKSPLMAGFVIDGMGDAKYYCNEDEPEWFQDLYKKCNDEESDEYDSDYAYWTEWEENEDDE